MKRDPIPAASAPLVLRNVAIQPTPHALTRRAATVPALPVPAPPAPLRTESAEARGSVAAPSAAEPVSPRHDDGVARAYEQGRAAGHAELREEFARERDATLDQARRGAAEEGMRQGHEQGLARAAAESELAVQRLANDARAKCAERSDRLEGLLAALPAQLSQRLDAAEDDMLALCHQVVCTILGDTVATPQGIRAMLNRAREQLGSHAVVAAHLHPQDWAAMNEAGELDGPAGVQWVPSADVQLGGLLLRTPQGSLDARLDEQMKNLRTTLLAVRSRTSMAAQPRPEDQP